MTISRKIGVIAWIGLSFSYFSSYQDVCAAGSDLFNTDEKSAYSIFENYDKALKQTNNVEMSVDELVQYLDRIDRKAIGYQLVEVPSITKDGSINTYTIKEFLQREIQKRIKTSNESKSNTDQTYLKKALETRVSKKITEFSKQNAFSNLDEIYNYLYVFSSLGINEEYYRMIIGVLLEKADYLRALDLIHLIDDTHDSHFIDEIALALYGLKRESALETLSKKHPKNQQIVKLLAKLAENKIRDLLTFPTLQPPDQFCQRPQAPDFSRIVRVEKNENSSQKNICLIERSQNNLNTKDRSTSIKPWCHSQSEELVAQPVLFNNKVYIVFRKTMNQVDSLFLNVLDAETGKSTLREPLCLAGRPILAEKWMGQAEKPYLFRVSEDADTPPTLQLQTEEFLLQFNDRGDISKHYDIRNHYDTLTILSILQKKFDEFYESDKASKIYARNLSRNLNLSSENLIQLFNKVSNETDISIAQKLILNIFFDTERIQFKYLDSPEEFESILHDFISKNSNSQIIKELKGILAAIAIFYNQGEKLPVETLNNFSLLLKDDPEKLLLYAVTAAAVINRDVSQRIIPRDTYLQAIHAFSQIPLSDDFEKNTSLLISRSILFWNLSPILYETDPLSHKQRKVLTNDLITALKNGSYFVLIQSLDQTINALIKDSKDQPNLPLAEEILNVATPSKLPSRDENEAISYMVSKLNLIDFNKLSLIEQQYFYNKLRKIAFSNNGNIDVAGLTSSILLNSSWAFAQRQNAKLDKTVRIKDQEVKDSKHEKDTISKLISNLRKGLLQGSKQTQESCLYTLGCVISRDEDAEELVYILTHKNDFKNLSKTNVIAALSSFLRRNRTSTYRPLLFSILWENRNEGDQYQRGHTLRALAQFPNKTDDVFPLLIASFDDKDNAFTALAGAIELTEDPINKGKLNKYKPMLDQVKPKLYGGSGHAEMFERIYNTVTQQSR